MDFEFWGPTVQMVSLSVWITTSNFGVVLQLLAQKKIHIAKFATRINYCDIAKIFPELNVNSTTFGDTIINE